MDALNNKHESYDYGYVSQNTNETALDGVFNNHDELLPLFSPNSTSLSKETEQDLKEFNNIFNCYYNYSQNGEVKNDFKTEFPSLDFETFSYNHGTENEPLELIDIADCKELLNLDYNTFVTKSDAELLIPATTIYKSEQQLTAANETNLRRLRKPNTTITNVDDNNTGTYIVPIKNEVFLEDNTKDDFVVILSSDDENDCISISSEVNNSEELDCSGYHSSDFEFIDENEAKKIGIVKREIAKVKDMNPRDIDYYLMPDNDEGHKIPEGDEFVNLFRGSTHFPTNCMEIKSVTMGFAMEPQFGGIGFDMRMLMNNEENSELKDAASETKRKIVSLYPEENRRMRRRSGRRHV